MKLPVSREHNYLRKIQNITSILMTLRVLPGALFYLGVGTFLLDIFKNNWGGFEKVFKDIHATGRFYSVTLA